MKEAGATCQFQARLTQFLSSGRTRKLAAWQVELKCLPIYWQFLRQELGWKCTVLCVLVLIGLLINIIPVASWTSSAIFRLILIQLAPYWKWTDLYNTQCVWTGDRTPLEKSGHIPVAMDCSVCENINFIPRLHTLSSFEELTNPYLPVVVPHSAGTDMDFVSVIYKDIYNHRPCDLTTNLVFNEWATLQHLKKRAAKASSYFFHFRLCAAEAVKQSRRIDGRPGFFPAHLPPAYSSWISLSQNYTSSRKLPLVLDGLIFVRQLQGSTAVRLAPRADCEHVCRTDHHVVLSAGEGLLFLSVLWDYSYSPSTDGDGTSISFISETDWK